MISSRIKQAREVLKFSQPEAAKRSGIPVGTLRKYEQGPSLPGADAIAGFLRMGISANWLLSGEGPMLLSDVQQAPVPPDVLDPERLALALLSVEEGLAAARRSMAPDKKAELVIAVYDLFGESSVSKERVLKLVKLAA